jgi:hypothetical protein
MGRYPCSFRLGLRLLATCMALPSPALVWADTVYKIQPIVSVGDKIGDPLVTVSGDFEIDALNDSGQLLFVTSHAANEKMFQFAEGKFTPLVIPGGAAPIGKWPKNVDVFSPVSMNQSGNAAFVTFDFDRIFLWDALTRQVTALALDGTPAVNDWTFGPAVGGRPAINNSNEIAFFAQIKDAKGKVLGSGVFFRGRGGDLMPVALPQQPGPDGRQLADVSDVSLNDAGRVGFLALRQGDKGFSAFVWEKGETTLIAQAGMDAPAGGQIVNVLGVWVNNQNRSSLLAATVKNANQSAIGLYLYADERLALVAGPGHEMPNGGKFKTLQALFDSFPSLSFPNDLGQQVFLARLEDKTTAAYMVEPDGKLSLILKSGTTTDLGDIRNVGLGAGNSLGAGLNNKGQVALTLSIVGRPTTIAILTPTAP